MNNHIFDRYVCTPQTLDTTDLLEENHHLNAESKLDIFENILELWESPLLQDQSYQLDFVPWRCSSPNAVDVVLPSMVSPTLSFSSSTFCDSESTQLSESSASSQISDYYEYENANFVKDHKLTTFEHGEPLDNWSLSGQLTLDLNIICSKKKFGALCATKFNTEEARKCTQLTVGMSSSHPLLRNLPPNQMHPMVFLRHSMDKGALLETQLLLSIQSAAFDSIYLSKIRLRLKVSNRYKVCSRCAKGLQEEVEQCGLSSHPDVFQNDLSKRFVWLQPPFGGQELYFCDAQYNYIEVDYKPGYDYRIFFPCSCEHQTTKENGRNRCVNIDVQLLTEKSLLMAETTLAVSISSTPARSFLRFFRLGVNSLKEFLELQQPLYQTMQQSRGGTKRSRKDSGQTTALLSKQRRKSNNHTLATPPTSSTSVCAQHQFNLLQALHIVANLDCATQQMVLNCFEMACQSDHLEKAQMRMESVFQISSACSK